jgi:hypothetical protein
MNKVFQAGDYVAVHNNPIWRDKANFIIRAYLEEKNSRSEWEQLWAIRLGDRRFCIGCIPFFAFDLALGDEVETDENYVVQQVIKASGQYTFRVWFGNSTYPEIKEEVLTHMVNFDVQVEWSSENLLAISACDSIKAQLVADYLYNQQSTGSLTYETGRTV